MPPPDDSIGAGRAEGRARTTTNDAYPRVMMALFESGLELPAHAVAAARSFSPQSGSGNVGCGN